MSVGAVNKQTGDRIPTAGMPAVDSVLSGTSTNPVQNRVVKAALDDKQDKTDNTLQTTDKTVVGAINEHEGDISSLKSGLTNLDDVVGDSYRNHVNGITKQSTTLNNVIFTNNNDGTCTIKGTANGTAWLINIASVTLQPGTYKLVGWNPATPGIKNNVQLYVENHDTIQDYGDGGTVFTVTEQVTYSLSIVVGNGASVNTVVKPMITKYLDATYSDFLPYHNAISDALTNVDARLDAVESGLTNYEAKIDAALNVPENTGKNLLPLVLNDIKSNNTNGTWSGNAFTRNGITFTLVYENNTIVGVNINGTATAETSFVLFNSPSNPIQSGDYIGSIDVYDDAKFWVDVYDTNWGHRKVIFTSTTFADQEIGIARLIVADGYNANDVTIHIMIRPATITDPTFAPYIPSVESRIEAVESGLTDMPMKQWQKNTRGSAGNVTFTFSSSVNRYAGLLFCINNSGVSAIFAVAYKEDIEPTITRLAGSDAITPSISIDGSITVGLYAWSTAILFANGNFV